MMIFGKFVTLVFLVPTTWSQCNLFPWSFLKVNETAPVDTVIMEDTNGELKDIELEPPLSDFFKVQTTPVALVLNESLTDFIDCVSDETLSGDENIINGIAHFTCVQGGELQDSTISVSILPIGNRDPEFSKTSIMVQNVTKNYPVDLNIGAVYSFDLSVWDRDRKGSGPFESLDLRVSPGTDMANDFFEIVTEATEVEIDECSSVGRPKIEASKVDLKVIKPLTDLSSLNVVFDIEAEDESGKSAKVSVTITFLEEDLSAPKFGNSHYESDIENPIFQSPPKKLDIKPDPITADDGDGLGIEIKYSIEPDVECKTEKSFSIDPDKAEVTWVNDIDPSCLGRKELVLTIKAEEQNQLKRSTLVSLFIDLPGDAKNPVFTQKEYMAELDIQTQTITMDESISAVDGDEHINADIDISLEGTGSEMFAINNGYLEVTSDFTIMNLPTKGILEISTLATQKDNPERFSKAVVKINYAKDELGPDFNVNFKRYTLKEISAGDEISKTGDITATDQDSSTENIKFILDNDNEAYFSVTNQEGSAIIKYEGGLENFVGVELVLEAKEVGSIKERSSFMTVAIEMESGSESGGDKGSQTALIIATSVLAVLLVLSIGFSGYLFWKSKRAPQGNNTRLVESINPVAQRQGQDTVDIATDAPSLRKIDKPRAPLPPSSPTTKTQNPAEQSEPDPHPNVEMVKQLAFNENAEVINIVNENDEKQGSDNEESDEDINTSL